MFYRRRTTTPIGGTTAKKLAEAKLRPPSPPPEVPVASSSTSVAPHRALPSTPPKRALNLSNTDTSPTPAYEDASTLRPVSGYTGVGSSPSAPRASWLIDDTYNWNDPLLGDDPEGIHQILNTIPDDDLSISPRTSSINVSEDNDEDAAMRREEVLAGQGNFLDEDYDAPETAKDTHSEEALHTVEAPETGVEAPEIDVKANPAHPSSPA